jgi:hypothetical protein
MRQRDSNVTYHLDGHMQQPTHIHGQLVHLIDFDMLAAEGSPLDLEEVQVYLNDPGLAMEFKFSNSHLLAFRKPHGLYNFHNNPTR